MRGRVGTECRRAGVESDVKAMAVLQSGKKNNPEVSRNISYSYCHRPTKSK